MTTIPRAAGKHRRTFCGAVAVAYCAPVLAGCGGSTAGRPTSPYGAASSPLALSKCMRANGLPNFPDPSTGPGGVGFHGISSSGPALQTAQKACKEYLPPGGPPPQLSASQKAAALAFARCMRSHGVPSFPDPNFNVGAGVGPAKQAPLDFQSPAFRQAATTCGGGAGRFIQITG